MTNYETAKELYLKGKSLRQIATELNIDRKKLSKKLKEDNIIVQKGIKDDDYKKACELYKQGRSITSIATEMKLDRHTLSKRMEADGVREPSTRHARNTKYDSEIISLYNDGMSIEKISKHFNISTNMVWNCLRANNIDTEKEYRQYNLNQNTFEVINTEGKAYWLGFLYADGYVCCDKGIEFALKLEDRSHVEKFQSFLGTNVPIKERASVLDGKIFYSARLYVGCKKMAKDLEKLGCPQAKTLILKFPTEEQVPSHLIHHFMRGYFDGDGSIFMSKPTKGNGTKLQRGVEILGTKEFLDNYMKPLYDIGVNKTKYRKHGQVYGSRHGGNKQAQLIYDFLYRDATIYLDRKHTKFSCRLDSTITEDSR